MTPAPSSVDALKNDPLEVTSQFNKDIPVGTFINEMTENAKLLLEHRGVYDDLLGVDSEELAVEIEKQCTRLLTSETNWGIEAEALDAESRFWFDNKDALWKLLRELRGRLLFLFKQKQNLAALAMLDDIDTTEDDDDAVTDGMKFCTIFTSFATQVSERYSAVQSKEITDFLTRIQKARAAAKVDRSAPNYARIERDRQYIALQKLEETMIEMADAAFPNDLKERRRYVSEYLRAKNRRYYENSKTESQKSLNQYD